MALTCDEALFQVNQQHGRLLLMRLAHLRIRSLKVSVCGANDLDDVCEEPTELSGALSFLRGLWKGEYGQGRPYCDYGVSSIELELCGVSLSGNHGGCIYGRDRFDWMYFSHAPVTKLTIMQSEIDEEAFAALASSASEALVLKELTLGENCHDDTMELPKRSGAHLAGLIRACAGDHGLRCLTIYPRLRRAGDLALIADSLCRAAGNLEKLELVLPVGTGVEAVEMIVLGNTSLTELRLAKRGGWTATDVDKVCMAIERRHATAVADKPPLLKAVKLDQPGDCNGLRSSTNASDRILARAYVLSVQRRTSVTVSFS